MATVGSKFHMEWNPHWDPRDRLVMQLEVRIRNLQARHHRSTGLIGWRHQVPAKRAAG